MPDPTLYTFLPPVLNKPVHGMLETGQTIRTSRIVILEASRVADTLLGAGSGYFVTTSSGSHYTLIVLPVSASKPGWRTFSAQPGHKRRVSPANTKLNSPQYKNGRCPGEIQRQRPFLFSLFFVSHSEDLPG